MRRDRHKLYWPAWRFGPNGESAVFEREEDVPAGWLDAPDKFPKEPEGDVVVEDTTVPMGRKEIISALKWHGVAFQRNAPTAKLYKQLMEVAPDNDCARDNS